MEPTGLDTQAYKLLILDIAEAEKDGKDFLVTLSASSLRNRSNSVTGVQSKGKKLTLKVNLVWIQGRVREIRAKNPIKVLLVYDGHDEAQVIGYDTVPGGDHPEIQPGSYVGILAEIIEIAPVVQLKPHKVMCWPDQPLLESIWEEEVTDLKAFLLGLIKPQ